MQGRERRHQIATGTTCPPQQPRAQHASRHHPSHIAPRQHATQRACPCSRAQHKAPLVLPALTSACPPGRISPPHSLAAWAVGGRHLWGLPHAQHSGHVPASASLPLAACARATHVCRQAGRAPTTTTTPSLALLLPLPSLPLPLLPQLPQLHACQHHRRGWGALQPRPKPPGALSPTPTRLCRPLPPRRRFQRQPPAVDGRGDGRSRGRLAGWLTPSALRHTAATAIGRGRGRLTPS